MERHRTPVLEIDTTPRHHRSHQSELVDDVDHHLRPSHNSPFALISSSSILLMSASNQSHKKKRGTSRRRRSSHAIAAAMAAAAAIVISSHSIPSSVEAFSTSPKTSATRLAFPALPACRTLRLWSEERTVPPYHMSLSGLPMMSMYEFLSVRRRSNRFSKSKYSKLLPPLGKSRTHPPQQRHLGSPLPRLPPIIGSSVSSTAFTSTLLSVSRSSSTTDHVLGFRVDDLDPSHNVDEELQFSFEDFGNYHEDDSTTTTIEGDRSAIRTLHPQITTKSASSSTSQQQRQQVVRGGAIKLGQQRDVLIRPSSRSARPKSKSITGNKEERVPSWLPWVPTESQINLLKKVELCAACAERGLLMTGNKAALQQRLLIWATVQDRRRVKNRLSGLKDLIELSKRKEKIISVVDTDVDDMLSSYDVEALTNKRKAMTKERKRTSRGVVRGKRTINRGILGLVDESYFSNSTGVVRLEDVDDDDDNEEEEEEEEEEDDDRNEEEATNDANMVNEESINLLSKTFHAPSSIYSNREVREMYIEAKWADQTGDRQRSKVILSQLRVATPHDMRVVRRLARMEQEDGNLPAARTILLDGLRMEPDNSHLLNGLGQIERISGNGKSARSYYRRAIKCNPSFPNSYHALGTLEHTHGNIRASLTIIKEGLKNCPRNHRLYHALGDVYLDANMLDLAEEAYLTGFQLGPEWSKSFFYTSLSFVAYAQGNSRDSRALLMQSLEINGGMHAQGVIALAQLDESEGDIAQARKVYRDALSSYEKKRRRRSSYYTPIPSKDANIFDTVSSDDGQGREYTRSYAGDKWINVFKSWARMEEIHGTYETAHIVYSKAARLFPDSVSLLIQWAELQANHGEPKKARLLYEAACHRVGSKSTEPYQFFAEFEMKRKNYVEAQSILSKGSQSVIGNDSFLASDDDGIAKGGNSGVARLFHTWGVCEYHLGTYSRAEKLFDDALRVTGSEEGDSAMRSLILYSMARLEYSRQEYLLAQHCIALSLKENLLPGGNYLTWKLWSQIADRMENEELSTRCKEQAMLRREEERGGAVSDLSRLLGVRNNKSTSNRLPERTGSAMKDMFRKTPWFSKVCPPSGRMDKNWFNGAKLWEWI